MAIAMMLYLEWYPTIIQKRRDLLIAECVHDPIYTMRW